VAFVATQGRGALWALCNPYPANLKVLSTAMRTPFCPSLRGLLMPKTESNI